MRRVNRDFGIRSSGPMNNFERLKISIERIFIWIGVASLFLLPRNVGGDGGARFEALSELLQHGTLNSNRFSLIGPIFSSPLWFLGQFFGQDPAFFVIAYNTILFCLALWLFYRMLAPELGGSVARRFLLLLLCASMFPNHIKHYYAEVFTALTFTVGTLAICLNKKPALGWTAAALGVANIPASLPGFGFATLSFIRENRKLRYALFVVIAAVLVLAEAWIRRGSPFSSGYEGDHGSTTIMPYSGRPGFSYPMILGLLSIFFSFGKGLVFFIPALFLPMRRLLAADSKIWPAYRMWILFLAGLILVYSRWWSWYGGGFWGPRYFLIACVPASLALALAAEPGRRDSPLFTSFALIAMTLSFWGAVTGSVFLRTNLEFCEANNYALEYACWYIPEFSALVRPFIAPKTLNARDYFIFAFYGTVYLWVSFPLWNRLISIAWERATQTTRTVAAQKWRL